MICIELITAIVLIVWLIAVIYILWYVSNVFIYDVRFLGRLKIEEQKWMSQSNICGIQIQDLLHHTLSSREMRRVRRVRTVRAVR
jgi:hypothetical protein